jgi:hypothetical protein
MQSYAHRSLVASVAALVIATVVGVTADITPGRGAIAMPNGNLTLNASLSLSSRLGGCAPPSGAEACGARTIRGLFPGLGAASGTYEFLVDQGPPACTGSDGRALSYPIRLAVAGKGEIHAAVAEATRCLPDQSIRTQTQTFTVTGGTGSYTGASGSGTLERRLGEETATGRHGREIWVGTLDVPGLEFDVTPPVLSGAVAKTVRAPRGVKRMRVTYKVAAADNADGDVPVSCMPRSGSRFPIGRTTVTCEATDSSGNTKTAQFRITVRARR